ncbi:MAG TPA: PhzF family phenazine biosynthesis protein [Marinagarivorans sp.]
MLITKTKVDGDGIHAFDQREVINARLLACLPAGASCFTVFTFCDLGRGGNGHRVINLLNDCYRAADPCALQNIKALSALEPSMVYVVLYAGVENASCVVYYQKGRAIKRCGSGTLAAAKILLNTSAAKAYMSLRHHVSEINGVNESVHIQGPVEALSLQQKSADIFAYTSDCLPLRRVTKAAASLWRHGSILPALNPQAIVGCYNAGGPKDYCVLVLRDEKALKRVQPNFNVMGRLTRRALIATAPASGHQTFDYLLRYFAPQYGNNEDAATGSAHLQVAQYWQQRFGKATVRGLQCSAEGGRFVVSRLGGVASAKKQQVMGTADITAGFCVL